MPETRRKTSSRKKHVSKIAPSRKTNGNRRPSKPKSQRRTIHRSRRSASAGETYIFECTRPGCGYHIVREEKAEVGQVRFDLKCPKCHHREFKCLGKGDLPEPSDLTFPITSIDLGHIDPVGLGSN